MTWGDWVDSDYNTVGATIETNTVYINGQQIKRDGYAAVVSSNYEIVSDGTYVFSS